MGTSGRTAVVVAAGVGLAAVAAVLAIFASARSDRNVVRNALGRVSSDAYVEYVAGVLERFVADVQTVATDWRTFLRVGATSVLIWSIDVATALVVFAAFGYELTATLVAVGFFAVSVGNLAKVLPLTPGGVGLYEGAFSIIVAALTPIAAAAAIGVAVVDHMVKNAVTIAGGLGSMALLNVSLTSAVSESRRSGEAEGGATAGEVEPTPSFDDT